MLRAAVAVHAHVFIVHDYRSRVLMQVDGCKCGCRKNEQVGYDDYERPQKRDWRKAKGTRARKAI